MFIKEIELLCDDISKAEKFYSEILGLVISGKQSESISFKAGTSTLRFKHTSEHHPYYHFAFNIPNNQIRQALAWLGKKVEIIRHGNQSVIDFKNWNAESVYFLDPFGNILELIARHDLDNKSRKSFSGSLLLAISEIGIVVKDINEACDLFKKDYKLLPYKQQPVLETFAALGDENGLVILSTSGRQWFPTDKAVEKFPLSITFENDATLYKLDV
jgi:catechol-2,3-dioxygenase